MEFTFKVKSYGFDETEESIWISSLNYNGLTQIDKKSGRIVNIFKYPQYLVWEYWLYSKPVICGRYIVSIPFRSKYISIFNMDDHEFQNFEMDERYFISDKGGMSLNGYSYKNYVYIFPAFLRCIIRVDVEKMTITYLTSGLEDIAKDISENDIMFRQQYEIIDNKVYIAIPVLGGYAVFDPETETVETSFVGKTGRVSTINHVGDKTYLGSWDDRKVYVIDTSGNIDEIGNFPQEYDYDKYSVANSCAMGDRIYYLPQKGNMILGLNTITRSFDRTISLPDVDEYEIHTYGVEGVSVILDDCEGIKELSESDNDTQLKMMAPFDIKNNANYISKYLISNGFLNLVHEDKGMDLQRYMTILTGKVEE